MFGTQVFQYLDLFFLPHDIDQRDTILLSQADNHAAELRSGCSLDDCLSLVLVTGTLEHADSSQRVDTVHGTLFKTHMIWKGDALHSSGDSVLLVAATNSEHFVGFLTLCDSDALPNEPPAHEAAPIVHNGTRTLPAGCQGELELALTLPVI
jgi:hypothetical protein